MTPVARILNPILADLPVAWSLSLGPEGGTTLMFGVMSTPALAVDGTVKFSGRVPTTEEIERILISTRARMAGRVEKCGRLTYRIFRGRFLAGRVIFRSQIARGPIALAMAARSRSFAMTGSSFSHPRRLRSIRAA